MCVCECVCVCVCSRLAVPGLGMMEMGAKDPRVPDRMAHTRNCPVNSLTKYSYCSNRTNTSEGRGAVMAAVNHIADHITQKQWATSDYSAHNFSELKSAEFD